MQAMGIFDEVNDEVGQIIVADVDTARIQELLDPKGTEVRKRIGGS